MIQYKLADADLELQQILALQQSNLEANISKEEFESQGFLTVEHDFALLKRMNEHQAHAIAKDAETVAAYALSMTTAFRNDIPILLPMFEMIDAQKWHGTPFSELNYYIMGQVCVGKAYRGQGVFDGLYQQMKRSFAAEYDLIVTEVSARNVRSLRAHKRVGFQTFLVYDDPNGETWELIAWDWT